LYFIPEFAKQYMKKFDILRNNLITPEQLMLHAGIASAISMIIGSFMPNMAGKPYRACGGAPASLSSSPQRTLNPLSCCCHNSFIPSQSDFNLNDGE